MLAELLYGIMKQAYQQNSDSNLIMHIGKLGSAAVAIFSTAGRKLIISIHTIIKEILKVGQYFGEYNYEQKLKAYFFGLPCRWRHPSSECTYKLSVPKLGPDMTQYLMCTDRRKKANI